MIVVASCSTRLKINFTFLNQFIKACYRVQTFKVKWLLKQ